MRTLFKRLVYFLRRSRLDAYLREETETHRSLRQEKLEREGAAPSEVEGASRLPTDHRRSTPMTCDT